ncbi:MAG: dihydroorotate dehydrogenase [Candidatus Margulisbacteria bacterium]|nr:dihydroorotate dehydrogenase [Candidatus Margulisiibacteriota bacterium]
MVKSLEVNLGKLILQNPITTASGCFGYGTDFCDFLDLDNLGAITLKSITKAPRAGNPTPRVAETPSGMMNSIGLANCGIKEFLEEKLPALEYLKKVKVIANIAGHSTEENVELAEILNSQKRVDAIELNISCPNVDAGGLAFCQDMAQLKVLLRKVRVKTDKPLIVKLAVNVHDIVSLAQTCEGEGADILSLINTVTGMEVDIENRKLFFSRGYAGLSGPAIRPIALKAVYDVARAVKLPLIGMGGIATVEDVVKFLMVGADAISVGMMNFVQPDISEKLVAELIEYLNQRGMKVEDLKL